jgi:hypothetical protein
MSPKARLIKRIELGRQAIQVKLTSDTRNLDVKLLALLEAASNMVNPNHGTNANTMERVQHLKTIVAELENDLD